MIGCNGAGKGECTKLCPQSRVSDFLVPARMPGQRPNHPRVNGMPDYYRLTFHTQGMVRLVYFEISPPVAEQIFLGNHKPRGWIDSQLVLQHPAAQEGDEALTRPPHTPMMRADGNHNGSHAEPAETGLPAYLLMAQKSV